MKNISSVIPCIESGGAFAMHMQLALRHQLFDGSFHGGFAEGRTQFHEVRFCDLPDLAIGGPADCFKGRELCTHQVHPLFKLPVGGQNNAQEILDKGGGIFLALMPALLALRQGIVVGILILGDLALQGDILPHHIAAAVEK